MIHLQVTLKSRFPAPRSHLRLFFLPLPLPADLSVKALLAALPAGREFVDYHTLAVCQLGSFYEDLLGGRFALLKNRRLPRNCLQ